MSTMIFVYLVAQATIVEITLCAVVIKQNTLVDILPIFRVY